MTITTSRFAALIDAVIAALNASPTFASPVRVFDGPSAETGWTDAVWVGFDGDWQQGTFEACQVDQTWAYLGATSQFEELHLLCAVAAWSGEIDAKGCRDRATVLLGGVETVLRTDPTLGMGGATQITLQVGNVFQEPFNAGLSCRIPFTVHASTVILSS